MSKPRRLTTRSLLLVLALVVAIVIGLSYAVGAPDAGDYPCADPRDLPAITDGGAPRSEASAREFLAAEGFPVAVVEPVTVAGAPPGVVIGQHPEPGTILCPADTVTIKITANAP